MSELLTKFELGLTKFVPSLILGLEGYVGSI